MHIRAYFRGVQETISRFPYIRDVNISLDERTEYIGLIKGVISFIDGSAMYFKEFLDIEKGIEKYKYGYHYEREGKLIFRYDNAMDPAAATLSTFPDHKHLDDRLLPSPRPTLEEVLTEVLDYLKL